MISCSQWGIKFSFLYLIQGFMVKGRQIFFFFFFFLSHIMWDIMFSDQESNPHPLKWKRGVLTKEPSEKVSMNFFSILLCSWRALCKLTSFAYTNLFSTHCKEKQSLQYLFPVSLTPFCPFGVVITRGFLNDFLSKIRFYVKRKGEKGSYCQLFTPFSMDLSNIF